MMQKEEKLILYSGGFIFYFFSILAIVFSSVFILAMANISKVMGQEQVFRKIGIVFGLLIMLWFIINIIIWLKSNRISLISDKLNISTVARAFCSSQLFPMVQKFEINLNDIQGIQLRIAQREEIVRKEDLISDSDGFDEFVKLPALPRLLLIHTPFMLIFKKEGEPFLIDTKPFSKRGIGKLVKKLSEKGIKVEIQQGVLK